MKAMEPFDVPQEKQPERERARRLEWITVLYLLSVVVLMYLVMGGSQAMKTAWLEDSLSIIPPIAFLIANHVRRRRPNHLYPWGYHRAMSIAFLCAAFALLTMGGFLLFDALLSLAKREHPTIGTMTILGHHMWAGWPMLAVLLYSAVPAAILGRKKLPLAESLHEKTLHADADMNKDDWLTAGAAAIGVVGIGFGLWWADAVAAAFISIEVLRDGVRNMRTVVADLMDRSPQKVDHSGPDAIPDAVRRTIIELGYVDAAQVRLREMGEVLAGEIFVVPADGADLVDRAHEIVERARAVHWRVHDVTVHWVAELNDDGGAPTAMDE